MNRAYRLKATVVLMFSVVLAMQAYGCGSSNEENQTVLEKQVERQYLSKVEYKEEHKEEIERTIDALVQAYIGRIEEPQDGMEVSANVQKFFNDIDEGYDTCSYKELADETLRDNEEYRVTAGVSYSRDCFIVKVTYPGGSEMLKMTYDDKGVETVTDYK